MTIEIRIELDDHCFGIRQRGRRYAATLVKKMMWSGLLPICLRWARKGYGTHHHNSASIIIKNDENEEEVSTRISVGDPRGGFVMESRDDETGHYLSVHTDQDSAPHIDDMEEREGAFTSSLICP